MTQDRTAGAAQYTVVMHYSNPHVSPLSIHIPCSLGGEYMSNVNMAQRAYGDAIRDMMLDDISIVKVQLYRNDHLLASMVH